MTATETEPGPNDQPLDGMPPMPPPPPPVDTPRQPGDGGRGRPRKRAAAKPAAKRPAAPSPRTRRPAGPTRPDYREGIITAIDSACIPLAIAAMRGDQLAALNLVTLDMHKGGMAESAQQLADMHPAADRVVAFLAAAGPMSGVINGLGTPILQMLCNAGVIPWPIAQRLGCLHPQQLLARLQNFDVHADQAQAAAAPAAPAPEPAPDPVI